MPIPFLKMHGLGNDFVVLDARSRPLDMTPAGTRALADRRRGIGFDQLLVIEPPAEDGDAFMRIRNADGTEVAACGNGARAVAAVLLSEAGTGGQVALETRAGVLECRVAGPGEVTVDMGPARLDWREVPLSAECDTLHLPLELEALADPVAVGMGNPHAVFFVPDAEAVDLARLGPLLERDPIFPERANIEVVERTGPAALRMRVWERGVGITLACGSGACAAAVAASRRGLTGREVSVVLDGGQLQIRWREDGHVLMTGPVATSFRGTIDETVLA